jgi:hypothetical protein
MNKYLDYTIKAFYIAVPFGCSILSAYHLIDFIKLANFGWASITIAIIIEIASLSCIFGLVTLDKIDKNLLWTTFWIVTVMQVFGNWYAAYDYLFNKVNENSKYLGSFKEMMLDIENLALKFILSFLLGSIMPVLSILQSKSLAKYLENSKKESQEDKEQLFISTELQSIKNEITNKFLEDLDEIDLLIEKNKDDIDFVKQELSNKVKRNEVIDITITTDKGTGNYKALIK